MARPIELTLAHSPDADDMAMWWPLTGMRDPEGELVEPPAIETGRFAFRPMAEDVEALNASAGDAELDITAISAAAWPALADRYAITDCGASFGEGYGPKVVVPADAPVRTIEQLRKTRAIIVPGLRTTAALVLRLLLGEARERVSLEARPFQQVAPAVLAGAADGGVLIHEAQLAFEGMGLRMVVDLGAWWHDQTGAPLPLGLNVIRRGLEAEHGGGTLAEVSRLLSASVTHARAHPDATRRYLLMHADARPEWRDAALLNRYLAMYVSDLTASMGGAGRDALALLYREAAAADLFRGVVDRLPTVDVA
ncbi:MAG: MqnA/MqnD/SBP family protein [Planctomycetota bacterium]